MIGRGSPLAVFAASAVVMAFAAPFLLQLPEALGSVQAMIDNTLYQHFEGSDMTHRTAKIDGTVFNIFDSQAGADRFMRENPEGDVSVVVRRKTLTMRRGGFEMISNVAGVVSNAREGGVQATAQALLDEIEAHIKLEIA